MMCSEKAFKKQNFSFHNNNKKLVNVPEHLYPYVFFSFPNQIIGTINSYILCIIERQVELIACEMYQEQYL